MRIEGNCGRSGRQYDVDDLMPSVLHGRLASDAERAVFPDDSCVECLKEGKVSADEKCFHRHWAEPTDEPRTLRRKTTSNTEAE